MEIEIIDLSVLDVKSMEISVVESTKLTAQIKEQARLAKKGIKEIAALTVKGCFQVQSAHGSKMQELSELSDKLT